MPTLAPRRSAHASPRGTRLRDAPPAPRRALALPLAALLVGGPAVSACAGAVAPSTDAGTPRPDAAPDAVDARAPLDAAGLDADAPRDVAPAPPDADAARDAAAPRDDGPARDAPAGCREAPAAPGDRGVLNDDPRFVSVVVNNVENLPEAHEARCPGDWRDLIYYLRQARPQPDLFLVQQVSNRAQLDTLVAFMNAQLRGTYAAFIADPDPRPISSPCGPPKDHQTNAIVYRAARFEPRGDAETWQPFAFIDGGCRRSGLSRTLYIRHRFRDRAAGRAVDVVSLHWSTNNGAGPDPACAEQNIRDLHARVERSDADLVILGGDANESDRNADGAFRDWYRLAREREFTDPILAECRAAPDLRRCLDDHWTLGTGARIDFLFARTGAGCAATTRRATTIRFDAADAAAREVTGSDSPGLDYSDHRAIRAEVYY